MPACVAHMLVARKVRERLATETVLPEFVEVLKENTRYMELGSLGPDLPYYALRGRWPHDVPDDVDSEPDPEPAEWTWGNLLHSKRPNVLPLELIRAIWHGSEGHWSDHDKKTFAFACGYLTHIAADQIVHPYVNRIAGPYNASHRNRHLHREVEVYQDVVLYATTEGGDLMKTKPNAWCDLTQGRGPETADWFRSMLRTAFTEAYRSAPEEGVIERWVDHLLEFLGWPKALRAYPRAARDFRHHGADSEIVQKAFTAIDYMHACFEPAIQLATMYLMAAAKFYGLDRWDDRYPAAFLRVVSGADLGDPQPEVDLEQVKKALSEWPTAAVG